MENDFDVMKEIRKEQLTRGMRCLAFLGFFALLASLSRAFYVGWHNIMYLHIGLYLLIFGTAVFNRYVPFPLKALIITGATYILGIGGLITWGLIGFGIPILFAFCMIATLLFGNRAGVLSAILSVVSIGLIGAGVVHGIIDFDFDMSDYLRSFTSWAAIIFGMIISAGIIGVIIATTNNRLVKLIQTLNTKNNQLFDTNKKLENALDESRKLKAGLEQAHKMELVGTLASGVAHDLNNVLAATVSYPELLLLQIPEDSPLRAFIDKIKKSGIKAAAIVDDLLTLARRGVQISEITNLNHIVTECISSPEIEKIRNYHPGVDIHLHLAENIWNMIGSPYHLMKTLTNLLSNAAEAMPDGGKITIATQNLKLSETISIYENIKPGDYVVLTVSDEGQGISDEDKEKIYEPFYTKKVMGKSGTGLGMTVVLNTIKDHDGCINMESIEGAGTVFSLYFPMTDKPLAQQKPQLPISEYSGRGESILVVDDVEEQREIASCILSALGYTVTTTSSGEEAVEFMKEHSTDLVILDMIMSPGMDGLETYKKILKLRQKQRAIIMSGYGETERIKEAQKLGAGTSIKKPYLTETVALAVRAELDKKSVENNNYH